MHIVTIYTTPYCVYCKMAKEFFKTHSVEFTERDVASDMAARDEAIKKSGQMAVPVIDVDGTVIVGFDESRLKTLLGIEL